MAVGESGDIALDDKIQAQHRSDSLNILVYLMLLTTAVLTIWMFKHRRIRYLHETGLALIFGLVIGGVIRYTGGHSKVTHLTVVPRGGRPVPAANATPPDTLWFPYSRKGENRTYTYTLTGEVTDLKTNQFAQLATFDPEIFFNIILPPIIFDAGYSLKRKFFFRNLGSILCFAFIGTTISTFVIGGVQYVLATLLGSAPALVDCFYFGALISATDPVTILAIFSDLHVDVNLYALVFGESVLNDAVAIVLATAVENYTKLYTTGIGGFEGQAFLKALSLFAYVFCVSFLLGAALGCATALLTKFTRLRDFPLLESSLFLLMSYASFLIAEAAELTGIVSVLFCGICQAHYTYNNLSAESRVRTKNFFQLLSFLAENFIFCYIGVSLFTFPKHQWDFGFIFSALFSVVAGRLANIYPLSAMLNLCRKPRIPLNFQHMMFLSGLRGAIAFALAIRNTYSLGRQSIYTATSIIVAVTVLYGGLTTQLLLWLGVPVGREQEEAAVVLNDRSRATPMYTEEQFASADGEAMSPAESGGGDGGKSWLGRGWSSLDAGLLKPLLTHARPTLIDTMPLCCHPLARLLTSTEQLTQGYVTRIHDTAGVFSDGAEVSSRDTLSQSTHAANVRAVSDGVRISPDSTSQQNTAYI